MTNILEILEDTKVCVNQLYLAHSLKYLFDVLKVSVVLFKLSALELLLQGDGEDMVARIQARQLLTLQPDNLTLEAFQQKFLSPSGIVL